MKVELKNNILEVIAEDETEIKQLTDWFVNYSGNETFLKIKTDKNEFTHCVA